MIIFRLLTKPVNVNEKVGSSFENALMIASHRGYDDIVQVLIEKGAGLDEKDTTDLSALMYATIENRISTVELLLHGYRCF